MYALLNCNTDRYISSITARGRSGLHTVSTTQDEDRALRFREEDHALDMLDRLYEEGALHGDDYCTVEVDA